MFGKKELILALVGILSAPLFAVNQWASCRPNQVMVFDNRIHVECAAAVGRIKFFAFPTNDSAKSSRMLSILSTAQVAGRNVLVLFEPTDASGPAYGCLASDCRPIIAAGFGN